MTDIVDNLRKIADAGRREDGTDIPLGLYCREAADEIERLRAERGVARAALGWQPIETAPAGVPVLCWIDGFLMVPNVLTKDPETGEWRESAVDGRVLRYPENIRLWMPISAPQKDPAR